MEARQLIRRITLASVLVAALVSPASAALAADDPSDYEPDGIGALFEVPDLKGEHDPTLFEKYPDSAYSVDWKSKGWTHVADNTVDPVLNGVANTILAASRGVTQAGIGLTWFLTDFDATTDLADQLTPIVGAVANSVVDWMLPSFLIIGSLIVFAKVRFATGEAINQLLAVILTAIVGLSLAVKPDVWTDTIQGIREIGMSAATQATTATSSELDVPFAGPTATYGSDESENSQRKMGDAIWRTFVVTPWCIAEFGGMTACEDFGETLLSLSTEERGEFLDGKEINGLNFPEAVGGKETAAWEFTTGQDGAIRMAIALPALVSAVVFAGLLIYLNAISLIYFMLSMLLLVIGIFFMLMWIVPGRFRQWGFAWLDKLFTFTCISVIATIVLTATVSVALAAMTLTGTVGWGVASILTFISSFASLLLFRHLREIFGFTGTGVAALIGGGLVLKHIVGRRHKTPTQPANTSPRGEPEKPETTTSGSSRPSPNTPRPRHTSLGATTPRPPGRRAGSTAGTTTTTHRPPGRHDHGSGTPAPHTSRPSNQTPAPRGHAMTADHDTMTPARDNAANTPQRGPQVRPAPRHSVQPDGETPSTPNTHTARPTLSTQTTHSLDRAGTLTTVAPQTHATGKAATSGGVPELQSPPRRRRVVTINRDTQAATPGGEDHA